jgi:hypothetical protein
MKKSPFVNALIVVVLILIAIGGFLFFALQDTKEINYPTSMSAIYEVPEVAPQTLEDFQTLFYEGNESLDTVIDDTFKALPDDINTPSEEQEDPEAYWQAIEQAWANLQPARNSYLRIVENPPYPLAYERFVDAPPSLYRVRTVVATALLKARSLQEQGKNPNPLLVESVTFIRNYYQSSSAVIDLMISMALYQFMLDTFEVAYLQSTPQVREALQEWKDTWRSKSATAMKLEFMFLYNELGKLDQPPSKAVFGDASGALGPFFLNFLFKPNQTFNRYWEISQRLGNAILEDDQGAIDAVETELSSKSAGGNWTNMLGNMILSMTVINVNELHQQQIEFEERIAPILTP